MASDISSRVKSILAAIPPSVTLVAATKGRSIGEIEEAVSAGVRIIGENYLREAEEKHPLLPGGVAIHFIGHLQKNKVKKALDVCSLIETVDSAGLALEISRRAGNRTLPVLLEVNSGREPQKNGVMPENLLPLLEEIGLLPGISVKGLMTMGPLVENPEEMRPFFRLTRELFEECRNHGQAGAGMEYLSMGMSDTWRVAVEEGATIIRVGTEIFGPRE